jgi:hypothetical protein
LFLLSKAVVLSKAISSQLEKALALQVFRKHIVEILKQAISTKNWSPRAKQQRLEFEHVLNQI